MTKTPFIRSKWRVASPPPESAAVEVLSATGQDDGPLTTVLAPQPDPAPIIAAKEPTPEPEPEEPQPEPEQEPEQEPVPEPQLLPAAAARPGRPQQHPSFGVARDPARWFRAYQTDVLVGPNGGA